VKRNPCPACRKPIDDFTSVAEIEGTGRAQPEAGDPTFCVYCGSLLVFREDLTLRFPTDEELVEFNKWPEIRKVRWAVHKVMTEMEGKKDG
jgi:hypothetical protein